MDAHRFWFKNHATRTACVYQAYYTDESSLESLLINIPRMPKTHDREKSYWHYIIMLSKGKNSSSSSREQPFKTSALTSFFLEPCDFAKDPSRTMNPCYIQQVQGWKDRHCYQHHCPNHLKSDAQNMSAWEENYKGVLCLLLAPFLLLDL